VTTSIDIPARRTMNPMTNIAESAAQAQIKELEEENRLILDQLQVVQEELERLHLDGVGSVGSQAADVVNIKWVDDELPVAMAEMARCRAILATQKEVYRLEAEHAVARKLGEILIDGVTSPKALLAVPARLLKVWRLEKKQSPPDELGGKGFEKVITLYHESGLGAVESLLHSVSTSATVRASALTALARSLMHQEPAKAAEIARMAYVIEPRPFRLKWLAFRLHEAGEVLEAESMLDVLPPETRFSDSEAQQASRVRSEAKEIRLREARQACGLTESRLEVERRIAALTQSRDDQAKLAMQRQVELDALRLAKTQKEREVAALTEQQETLRAEITALSLFRDKYEALAARHEEQARLAAERQKQIGELQEQIKSRKATESELSVRQQGMHEELVRAEAQLDLIKDMLLREPRL